LRLVIVSSRIPYPLEKGDKLRLYHQVKGLAQSHELHLISLYDKDDGLAEADSELEKYCSSRHFFKFSKSRRLAGLPMALWSGLPFTVKYFYSAFLADKIRQAIFEIDPDLIYCQLIRMAPYVRSLPFPKTLDYMDAFSLGFERRASFSPFWLKPLMNFEAGLLKNYENKVYKDFDSHTIISTQDRDHLSVLSREKIEILKNGVDQEFFYPNPDREKKYDLVFCGNMGYDPNVKAALLIGRMMPELRKQHPGLTVLIAGARPDKRVKAMDGTHGITVSGWMDDIRDAYWSSRINIAPIFSGSGLQNKILEAMACGIPCIASSVVAGSIDGKQGKDLLTAASLREFKERITEVLNSEKLANNLAQNGIELVRSKYNWDTFSKKLDGIIRNTAGSNAKALNTDKRI